MITNQELEQLRKVASDGGVGETLRELEDTLEETTDMVDELRVNLCKAQAALEDLKKEGKELSPLAVKAHSNRAACYKQISNFDGVIEGKYLESQSETVFFPARSLGQSPFSSSHTELSCLFVSSLLLFAQIALPFSRSTPTTLRPSSAVRRPSRDWSATASHFRMSSKCSACPTTRSAR